MPKELIEGRRVAVVGCGTSPVGKGLGMDIDDHEVVIRCNRSLFTDNIEHDYGSRTSLLVVGNPGAMMRLLPADLAVPVIAVPQPWQRHARHWEASPIVDKRLPDRRVLGDLWPHGRKPLAGTFAALYAKAMGASWITLYGIDLYSDGKRTGNSYKSWSMFTGHVNRPPAGRWDLSLDEQALAAIPCLTWMSRS